MPRRPFRLNVGFIVNQPVGYNRNFDFEFPEIRIDNDLFLTGFTGTANIGRTPQGLLVQADFEATTQLECVRCLNDYQHQLHWTMTELYAFNQKSVTESELILPEDAHIDLETLVREYCLLEVPISPVCKPDCKGLCTVCGNDLNEKDCGHRPEVGESPFSTLKELLDN